MFIEWLGQGNQVNKSCWGWDSGNLCFPQVFWFYIYSIWNYTNLSFIELCRPCAFQVSKLDNYQYLT